MTDFDLERLIQAKRAAGRPKDRAVIAELEAILKERGPDREEGAPAALRADRKSSSA